MQNLMARQMGRGCTQTGSGIVTCVAHSSPSQAPTVLKRLQAICREMQLIPLITIRALLKRVLGWVAEEVQLVGDGLPEGRVNRAAMQGIDLVMDNMALKPSRMGRTMRHNLSTSSRRASTIGSGVHDPPDAGMIKPRAHKRKK